MAWLLDDAYVYFRYADNLVIHGAGFVWNPGEFVEGFSSPLWALVLVALRFLHLDYWDIVPAAGVLCYAALWWAAVLVNRRLADEAGARVASVNLPLVYLTFNYGLLTHLTSGLETPLVLVAAGVYACVVLWPKSRALQVLAGLSPMVRHELLVPFVLLLVYLAVRNRRAPLAALVSCTAGLGGYVAFRVWYYADLLPNTFYLKDEVWLRQGFRYLYDAFVPYGAAFYALAALGLFLVLRRARGPRGLHAAERLVMVGLAVPVVAYTARIGGSSLHMKALVFPFALGALAAGGLAEAAASRWDGRASRRLWIAAPLLGLAVAACHPRQVSESPVLRSHGIVYCHADLIGDAYYQKHTDVDRVTPPWGSDILSYDRAKERYAGHRRPAARPEWWCRTAYVRPAAPVVHSLGLTEPFLARTHMRSDRPDHKEGLKVLADHIAWLRQRYGFRRGVFDDALRDGVAPSWVAPNIVTIRLIEAKTFNRHRFLDNLGLALSRVPKIERPQGKGSPEGPSGPSDAAPGPRSGPAAGAPADSG
jgi:hypothetical protein